MKSARKYRKKPIVVEAIQWTGQNLCEIMEFCDDQILDYNTELIVGTLEGPHIASTGDFIIKGIAGECYPCKPDIFERTYELA